METIGGGGVANFSSATVLVPKARLELSQVWSVWQSPAKYYPVLKGQ
ncbi:MAG TPA: hypothetical protein VGO57_11000 [Verrucomicrobiae bacterium]